MPSARRVNWAKFRVTVVSCVALLILSTLVYLLTGSTLLHEQAHLYLYLSDATGISAESPVQVNGIVVGQVSAVQLSGSNQPDRVVRITLDVLQDRLNSITSDSYAEIASDSLVGDKLIAITSGTSPAAVRPGGELRVQTQPDLIKTLDLSQFETQLRAVDASITEIEQGQSALGQFVLGDQMYQDLGKRIAEIEQGLRAAVSTTNNIGEALYTDRLYSQIRDPIVRFDQTLATIQSGQGSAGQFLRDNSQFESLRNDIANLRKSIATLQSGDFISSDQMYHDWNRSLAALIQQVDEANANPMFNTSEMYESMAGALTEMRDTIKDFRDNPRKFLRLKMF
jgi:phospholipid/cholesterol/gamma-HCH transport system substrate-binding protein